MYTRYRNKESEVINMTETMGQIIKRLRKERNLTQEELAEQLNISAPAVSKWENGTSMPDISQVVPLANLFGVPTDVLFGVYGTEHGEEVDQRLKEIYEIYDGCKDGEEGSTALIILEKYRDAIRTYPNNASILTEAIAFGTMITENNEPELIALVGREGLDSLEDEIISWAERVIKYSTSQDSVLSAKRRLIDIYVHRNNRDEAYSIAETFPGNIGEIRSIIMADLKYSAGDTAEQKKYNCFNIVMLASQLGHQTAMLGNLYMREGKFDDALYCYTFFRKTVEAMYTEEKYRPPFIYDYYPMYRFPAECLVKLHREDEALGLLEEGVDFILTQAENFNKKRYLDVPLFRDYSFGYGHDGNAEYHDLKGRLNRFIKCDTFMSLYNNPRYISLVRKVENIR